MTSKIVFVYAKKHWDIGQDPVEGVGLYAKTWFNALSTVFQENEILYFDHTELGKLRGIRGVDRLFSIPNSIERFHSITKASETNLIAVNEHALMRRRVRGFAKSLGVSKTFLGAHDGIKSNLKEIDHAANVIALGSWNVFKSFELCGHSPNKVYTIGWSYWNNYLETYASRKRTKILLFLGFICVRKGIFFIKEILSLLVKKHPNLSLNLVGFTDNSHLESWLIDLESQFPFNFTWTRERVTYGEKSWLQMRSATAFALFPSWEEGLAGCALDVINLGIPVIHSDRTGLEASHDLIAELDFFEDDWVHKLDELIQKGPSTWIEIHRNQKRAAFYQDQKHIQLERVLRRLKRGNLWPGIGIIGDSFIPKEQEEFNSNLDVFGSRPEFIIQEGTPQSNSKSQINLNFKNRGELGFSGIDSLRASIMVLDKYQGFDVLRSTLLEDSRNFAFAVTRNLVNSFELPSRRAEDSPVSLTIFAYHNSIRSKFLEQIIYRYWCLFLSFLNNLLVNKLRHLIKAILWKLKHSVRLTH